MYVTILLTDLHCQRLRTLYYSDLICGGSSLYLYLIQNLSRRFLNEFKLGADTALSGKQFHKSTTQRLKKSCLTFNSVTCMHNCTSKPALEWFQSQSDGIPSQDAPQIYPGEEKRRPLKGDSGFENGFFRALSALGSCASDTMHTN